MFNKSVNRLWKEHKSLLFLTFASSKFWRTFWRRDICLQRLHSHFVRKIFRIWTFFTIVPESVIGPIVLPQNHPIKESQKTRGQFHSIPFHFCVQGMENEKKQKTLQLYCVPRAIVLPHNKRIVLGSRDYEFYFRLVFGLFCVNFWMAMDKRNFLPDLRKSCWIPMI